jgi:hypothetical protein
MEEQKKPYVDGEETSTEVDELAVIGMTKEERKAYEKKIEENWLRLANRHNRRQHAAMQRQYANELKRRNVRNAKKAKERAAKEVQQ